MFIESLLTLLCHEYSSTIGYCSLSDGVLGFSIRNLPLGYNLSLRVLTIVLFNDLVSTIRILEDSCYNACSQGIVQCRHSCTNIYCRFDDMVVNLLLYKHESTCPQPLIFYVYLHWCRFLACFCFP